MEIIYLIIATAIVIYFAGQFAKHKREQAHLQFQIRSYQQNLDTQQNEIARLINEARYAAQLYSNQKQKLESTQAQLQRYQALISVEDEVARLEDTIKTQKDLLLKTAKQRLEQAEARLSAALIESKRITDVAHAKADEIAGDAYSVLGRYRELQEAAIAMKNKIDGYGNEYIVPTYNLLDELAEEISYTEAGQKLKDARKNTQFMVRNEQAATML